MKNLVLFFLLIGLVSCSTNNQDLVVKGSVKGLKKGTLYLQKIQDKAIVNVDSVSISGASEFELSTPIDEPEIFYLVLDKNAKEDERIAFFGNSGITEIHTTLKNFAFDAKINGSEQQTIFQEYTNMTKRYNNKNLDLIKANFDAMRTKDSVTAFETDTEYKNLIKSKYLYTINFAINNKTSQVAPYLAITEIFDAQVKYLDTIYVSLPDSIATSKYGVALKSYIKDRKLTENKN